MGAIQELTRNAVNVLPEGGLKAKLELGRPLRVKLGIDVTSPDVHIGRGIPLQRLRAFQDAGHKAVLIIGDYTTRIGDPSGRSKERPVFTDAQIEANAATYLEQALRILRDEPELLEVRRNGEWLAQLSFADLVGLTRTTTVAQLLERDDFKNRFDAQEPISVSELLYPLAQAYDSVAVDADVELGGTDQLYNLLAGREVMTAYGKEPQVAMTFPLLVSWDGQKMSSSEGNNIPLTLEPNEMFGRTMRISDETMADWYRLVAEMESPKSEPMDAKLSLAHLIVARSHGAKAADEAADHFTRTSRERQAPAEMPTFVLPTGETVHLPALVAEAFAVSRNQARTMINDGAVKIDGEKVIDFDPPRVRLAGKTLRAGKRRFALLSD